MSGGPCSDLPTCAANVARDGGVELGNRETKPKASLMSGGPCSDLPNCAAANVARDGGVELGKTAHGSWTREYERT